VTVGNQLTEVYQDLVYALGDLLEKGAGDHLVRGVLAKIDGNKELLSLLIDIADINTTLVSEEDPVTLSENVSILITRRKKLRTKAQIHASRIKVGVRSAPATGRPHRNAV